MDNISIINLTKVNSKEIASLHKLAFPGFFLSNLGVKFLKVFYSSILSDTNSIGLGIVKDNKIIGFAIGSSIYKSFYKKIFINNFLKLSFYILIPLIKNPSILIRIIKSLVSKSANIEEFNDPAVLLSICVQPNVESKGLGKLLLTKFEDILFNRNDLVILTTDTYNNDYVNLFYQKNGYKIHSIFLQGNRTMNLYYKKINN